MRNKYRSLNELYAWEHRFCHSALNGRYSMTCMGVCLSKMADRTGKETV